MYTGALIGVGVGIGVFVVIWVILEFRTAKFVAFTFEPDDGFFEKILAIYLDLGKFIIGLASGGIVFIVGSSAFAASKHLPAVFASPLFILAMSVFFGVTFMPLLVLNYESFRHKNRALCEMAIHQESGNGIFFSNLFLHRVRMAHPGRYYDLTA